MVNRPNPLMVTTTHDHTRQQAVQDTACRPPRGTADHQAVYQAGPDVLGRAAAQQPQCTPSATLGHVVNLAPLSRIQDIRKKLVNCNNVLPPQRLEENDKAAIIVRQDIYASLYDRISTRPFLNTIEKKWITYQLLNAVAECHAASVISGRRGVVDRRRSGARHDASRNRDGSGRRAIAAFISSPRATVVRGGSADLLRRRQSAHAGLVLETRHA